MSHYCTCGCRTAERKIHSELKLPAGAFVIRSMTSGADKLAVWAGSSITSDEDWFMLCLSAWRSALFCHYSALSQADWLQRRISQSQVLEQSVSIDLIRIF